MDVNNEVTMFDPTARSERSDGLPDQVIQFLEQQPQQFNELSALGSFSMHYNRFDSAYLEDMVAKCGSVIPELDSQLGLSLTANKSNCDTRLPDIDLNRMADEIFTLKIQTKQQHDMILDLQKQVKILADIHRVNPQTFLCEQQWLHQTQEEQEPIVQQGSSRTQLEINEMETVTEKGRSPLSDCSGATEQIQEMETVQLVDEKCTESSVMNDVEHHDESEEIISSDINRASRHEFLCESQQLNLNEIQVDTEPAVDNVTSNGQWSDECNETIGIDTRLEDDDVQQHNEWEAIDQSASSHQENSFIQSEGSFRSKQIRSVRARKGAIRKIAHSSGGTDASPKDSRTSCKEAKTYSCEECNKRFNLKGNLTQHLRVHSGEKPYQCKVCNVAFKHSNSLKLHQRIHSGEKPYQCKVCTVAFSQLGSLKSHQRIHSDGEKPYQCKVCNAAFNQSGNLKSHQRIHSGEKPYQCKVCNVAFKHSGNLKSHQRIHSGEKPYQCKVCTVAFSQLGSLKSHQRIHSGEKPYQCEVCNDAFKQLSHLNKHQRIHSGEKPFVCDICKKSFRQKSILSNHMDIHRGVKCHECKVCKKEFRRKCSLKNHLKIHFKENPEQF